uniref:CASP-like protein n=1 Tax=Oryza brachyantha TaxID=4533 RepID=J3L1L2_ORYBR
MAPLGEKKCLAAAVLATASFAVELAQAAARWGGELGGSPARRASPSGSPLGRERHGRIRPTPTLPHFNYQSNYTFKLKKSEDRIT